MLHHQLLLLRDHLLHCQDAFEAITFDSDFMDELFGLCSFTQLDRIITTKLGYKKYESVIHLTPQVADIAGINDHFTSTGGLHFQFIVSQSVCCLNRSFKLKCVNFGRN